MKRGIVAGTAALAAAMTLLSSAAQADTSCCGLSIERILDAPNHGDAVQFTSTAAPSTPYDLLVADQHFSMPLDSRSGARLFGDVATPFQVGPAPVAPAGSSAQVLGLSFPLLGGQSSVSFVSAPNAWHGGGPTQQLGSQGPAVFAFYNFPQIAAASPLKSIFGFGGQPGALGDQTPTGEQGAQAASFVSFPLVNSLSAQGPFWFAGYAPPLSGSSISLNIPVKLARFGVGVRLGEQSLSSVQPASLTTQILGPAFASASNFNAFNGGVTLALPLLNRRATVSLDGLYESLQQNNGNAFNPSQIPGQPPGPASPSGPLVLSPGSTNLQQYVGAASLAVPVTSRLTVKGSFSEQVGGSVDLNTLTQSLTQHATGYAGGLVYNIPRTNSSINLFFNRNVYTDDATASSWAQNQQNLYFSVKF